MFGLSPRKVSLTLFCSLALVLALSAVAQADALDRPVARDHAVLNRMLKKRIALPSDVLSGLTGTNGASSDPPTFSDADGGSSSSSDSASTSASSPAASSSPSTTAQTSSSADTSASSATTSSASTSTSASSAATSDTSSASSDTSSSSSSAPSSQSSATSAATSSAPAASQTQTQQQQQQQTSTQTQQQDDSDQDSTQTTGSSDSTAGSPSHATVTGVVMVTSSATAAPAVAASASAVSPGGKTAIIVLAVIAGSVAALVIAWTIIRKTKFKKSSSFEDRMNPIDWQPSTSERDPGSAGLQRNASAASHGSFHSSSAHGSEDGYSRYGGASSLQPLPDHDFTAGAALAPVGGYADLARGPSPGPQMAELNRGPSTTRPNYDYGVPLHHQGGYDYNGSVRY